MGAVRKTCTQGAGTEGEGKSVNVSLSKLLTDLFSLAC